MQRKNIYLFNRKSLPGISTVFLVNSVTHWLNLVKPYLVLGQIAVFNSWEAFWFSALNDWKSLIPKVILYACVAENCRHFSWPVSKDEKVFFLYQQRKKDLIFLLFQLVVIYMCAKNRTLASQNSLLCAAQICQISHAEHESPALLFWLFLCFFTTTPVLLPCGAMVLLLLHESLHKCCTFWSGIYRPAADTIWINKEINYYKVPYCCQGISCSLVLLQGSDKKAFSLFRALCAVM